MNKEITGLEIYKKGAVLFVDTKEGGKSVRRKIELLEDWSPVSKNGFKFKVLETITTK